MKTIVFSIRSNEYSVVYRCSPADFDSLLNSITIVSCNVDLGLYKCKYDDILFTIVKLQ